MRKERLSTRLFLAVPIVAVLAASFVEGGECLLVPVTAALMVSWRFRKWSVRVAKDGLWRNYQ